LLLKKSGLDSKQAEQSSCFMAYKEMNNI